MKVGCAAVLFLMSTFAVAAAPPTQQAYLKASNTGEDDRFGYSVAVSGDTMVIGARREDSSATGVNGDQSDDTALDSGAAYIFVRDGTNWVQQAYLKASNTQPFDYFGGGWVAIDGDTVVIGADGSDNSAAGVNADEGDYSTPDAGAAYVFARNGTNWTQQAFLKASNPEAGDGFGGSVAISGNTVIVGALSESSNATGVDGDQTNNNALDSGAAYIFVRSGTNWNQQAYLKASNTGVEDFFGWSVSVSGDTVVIAADSEDSNASGVNGNQNNNSALDSGAAYVFVRNGTTWTQQAYLKASNTEANDYFASQVAVSGDTVVVGAAYENSNAVGVNGDQSDNSALDSGAAYVFVRSGTNWTQQAYLKASNSEEDDHFGWKVAISGNVAVIGADGEESNATGINGDQDDNSASEAGAAYVFVRSGTAWSQQAYLKASNTDPVDSFTESVAVSGDTVVIAAHREDSSAMGVNGDQDDNSAVESGAAYVFTGLPPLPPFTRVLLTWPASAYDFMPEGATSIQGLWFPLTETVVQTGGPNQVTVDSVESAKFFRLTKVFREPALLGPPVSNPSTVERAPSLSSDGLSLYFFSNLSGNMDLWMTTRASLSHAWQQPINLQAINTPANETWPAPSADGLSLFFSDSYPGGGTLRPGGFGGGDLWVSTRESLQAPWQTPLNLGPVVNTSDTDNSPAISSDGMTLIFASRRPGNGAADLWITTRSDSNDPLGWAPPTNLGTPINSASDDASPSLSRDGLTLYFMSNRGGTFFIWVATRHSLFEPFGTPVRLATTDFQAMFDPCISADGSTLFFDARRLASDATIPESGEIQNLWQLSVLRPPPLSISRIQMASQP